MTWVNVDKIRRDLPAFLQRIEAGETIIITQAGKPVAEIKPIASDSRNRRAPLDYVQGSFTFVMILMRLYRKPFFRSLKE
jgi:antitoxin (DNA-binding transcriptional repressor) of toxin-antitoxin stability system